MTKRELVTITIPFAQVPLPHLQDAIRSVFAQTYQDWELVLLPDGIFPDVHECLSRIRDPRVRLIDGSPNRGLAARLNQSVQLANGSLMVRMDADDVMHPERVAKSVEALGQGWDVIGTRAYLIDADTNVRGAFREPPLPDTKAGFLRSNAFSHPTVAGHTSWFSANPYDETLRRSEDKELWLRTAGTSRFAKLDEHLMYYRVGDLSRNKQGRDAAYDRMILRSYGPRMVGRRGTAGLVMRSWVKQQAFAAASLALPRDAIMRSKVNTLPEEALCSAKLTLCRARSAAVRGWAEVVQPQDSEF